MNCNNDRHNDGSNYERLRRDATLRALQGAPVAIDQLQKTETGRRLVKVYIHVLLRGRDISGDEWLSLATLFQAAAHGADADQPV